MTASQDILATHISVAFKRASKDLRSRFASSDWMVAEKAGAELAALAAASLSGFDFTQKPMKMSEAASSRGEPKW